MAGEILPDSNLNVEAEASPTQPANKKRQLHTTTAHFTLCDGNTGCRF